MTSLEIDLSCVAANYRRLAAATPQAACAAVVKADAYGLGLEAIGKQLLQSGCGHFFVADAQEAAALRQVCPNAEIFVLAACWPDDFDALRAVRAVPVINDLTELEPWRAGMCAELPYAVQFDSGMSRLGLGAEAGRAFLDLLHANAVPAPTLLMSHLACAEEPQHPLNTEQLAICDGIRAAAPQIRLSLANSSGIFLGHRFHFDLVRPGAALYGINPTPGAANPMQAVVRWRARVVQTRRVAPGGSVGYGAAYRAAESVELAIVGAGYADGYPRSAGNRSRVVIAGQRAPVVGRVSMDLLAVDISAVSGPVTAGDTVDMLGSEYGLDDLANDADTIAYELLTRIGPASRRSYTG